MTLDAVNAMMRVAVADGIFPGGVLCVSCRGRIVFHEAYGLADIYTKTPVTTETVFDLASLTKPIATAPAVMRLVTEGEVSVTDPIGGRLPGFSETDKHRITIAQLLCHCSGLPAHREFFYDLARLPAGERRAALTERLVATKLVYPPGERVLYSDLGYMVLRCIVEAVSGHRLDMFVEDKVYRPLGITGLFFVPLHETESRAEGIDKGRFAATEDCPRRGFVVKGVVHDDNAYEAGGVDGHAGLFGTTAAVHAMMTELLAIYRKTSYDGTISHDAVKHMLEPQLQTRRTFGFDTPDAYASSAGTRFSGHTVGHLGFTGTSVWMDVARDIVVVLLTNRVHPNRKNEAIRDFRPALHDAVMDVLTDSGKPD
ncbi:MAG: serine hydrolase [Thermodesulfobacteriota bacterium]|nr:serine hydrolase [Thermodesulfobacteriota bacterium]